jgi:hypothetical protein
MKATLQTQSKASSSAPATFAPVRRSLLQRKCACGGTPGPSGECEGCRKKRLQSKVAQPSTLNHQHSEVPPIVHDVLRPLRQPLDAPTRTLIEPRFGHDFSKIRAHKDSRAGGLRASKQPTPAPEQRSDGLDNAPYRGPDQAAIIARGPGAGTSMGCVIGPMRLVTSGALEGGYTVNDYLLGGLLWPSAASPGSAGAAGRTFKVQLCASYSNATSLGVSQTMTHGGSNQAFLNGTAAYLGRAAGSVTNGATFNEPVLNAGNPYAHTGWELQYGAKSGAGSASLVSFADVPAAGPGEQGYIDFRTCFYSRGGPCQENEACRTWRWTVDFTGTNNVNSVV